MYMVKFKTIWESPAFKTLLSNKSHLEFNAKRIQHNKYDIKYKQEPNYNPMLAQF